MRVYYKSRISILILRDASKLKTEDRLRIEKNLEILRFENKFIDKIKTFFINDIVFENDI